MVAGIALVLWPLVAVGIFFRLGLARGLIWTTLVGFLFLPEVFGFDVPGIRYDKRTAVAFSLLLALMLFVGREKQDAVVGDRKLRVILWILVVVLFLGPVITILDNRYPLIDGPSVRPALDQKDLLGLTMDFAVVLTPFFLAWRWLTTPRDHIWLLSAIVMVGLFYSLLVLFEIRISPQLHNWVYGFFPHSFVQHVRGGGFRPLVFMNHGLELGFYLFMTVIAAFALSRQERNKTGMIMLLAGFWLLGVLMISSNTGAAMLALLFGPIVLMLGRRVQLMTGALVAVVFLSYPALRQADLIPVDGLTSVFSSISEERARSFSFRMENEEALLERALEKPVFGWGPWARGQIFNNRGDMISVPDGIWVIVLGDRGWSGFLGFFGLMAVPLLFLWRASRRKPIEPATAGLAIIAAGNLIYMIPNSTVSPLSALVFGALAGYAQWDSKLVDQPAETKHHERATGTRYSRFAPGERALMRRE